MTQRVSCHYCVGKQVPVELHVAKAGIAHARVQDGSNAMVCDSDNTLPAALLTERRMR
jgi:hypothetical protein